MKLQVFNVEHGACALLTDDNGKRLMFDCGHNGSTGWYPGTGLANKSIYRLEGLFVTNYDEDHVSGIVDLFEKVFVASVWRNSDVRPSHIRQLKSKDGMGKGIDYLVTLLDGIEKHGNTVESSGLGMTNVGIQTFWNLPTQFDDENNLSMVVVLTCGAFKFLFTGDLEEAGWMTLLQRQDFRSAIADVEVLMASHHGRESGCCNDLFKYCHPRFVVISDKAKGYKTQETTNWYRANAKGGHVGWESGQRHVLTTRSDGSFEFDMVGTQYWVKQFQP